MLFSGLSGVSGQTQLLHLDSLRNVHLQEVVVTAIQPDEAGTNSVIGREAIRHIQATDLSGLSQLLPGVLTRNPDLNNPAAFTIRSASYNDATNAMGTAIIVDGLPMNNNVNMQQATLGGIGKLFNSSALAGYDVRSLAPSSVEEVEVIRGIPSARYGDVTSGVVLVKSKAGIQPYTVGLRFTATEKLASIGKGMKLGHDNGNLYIGADYALSTQDARQPEQDFQRIGLQAAFAKDFHSATLRMNLRAYHMEDKGGEGANKIAGEYQKALAQGLSFSFNGQWNLKKSWLSTLEYNTGLNVGYQKNRSNIYYSGTRQVATYATEAGEHSGIFLPPNYFSAFSVEGKPLSFNVSLIANLQHSLSNKVYNNLSFGIEMRLEGNRGKGIHFDPQYPPLEMVGARVRSYRDIPFVYDYTAFGENKFTFKVGNLRTELQTGLRFNYLQTRSLNYSPVLEPRINIRQVLWEQDRGGYLNRFSVRAGWGLMRKMPILAYLYPDKYYTDESSFTYNDVENDRRLAVLNTYITDKTFNPDLRLPVNNKFEIGINLRIKGITADIVWFKEHLRDGYCTSMQAEPYAYRRYTLLTDAGEHPELTDEGVMNNGVLLPYTVNNTFALYRSPQNGIEQRKKGVEYTLDFGYWQRIRTSLIVSGSYLKMDEKDNSLTAFHPSIESAGKPYPYVGIYEATGTLANLRTWQLCSSRFQCITQIPRIGLIASLTLQAVWMDKQRCSMESNYNNPVYMIDNNGNRIDGNPLADTEYTKCLNPVYYLDGEGNSHRFTSEMAVDKRFADLVLKAGTLTMFQEDSFGPYFLLNLRLTKKIGRHFSVAFCANNLTRSNPKRYSRSTQQYSLLNPDLYYGAEVNIQF